jgi:hypothetical protein
LSCIAIATKSRIGHVDAEDTAKHPERFLLGRINAGSTRNVVKQLQRFVRPLIKRALERRNAERCPRRK